MKEIGGDYWIEAGYFEQIKERTAALSMQDKVRLRERVGEKLRKELQVDRLSEHTLLFSGRTCLDAMIEDILSYRKLEKAYLPSYCCSSMLQPFIDRKIAVDFYEVTFDTTLKKTIDYDHDCDLFLSMSYFGYQDVNLVNEQLSFFKKNVIVVEDKTQNLFSQGSVSPYAHYTVVSLRKWFHVACGAILIKKEGELRSYELQEDSSGRVAGMYENQAKKQDYLFSKVIREVEDEKKQKEAFLSYFHYFHQSFYEDYAHRDVDELSLMMIADYDFSELKSKRINNAKQLHQRLRLTEGVQPFFDLAEGDCPLYVPIWVKAVENLSLQRKVGAHQVYLPIHWRFAVDSPYEQGHSEIYQHELSLVCDQRYGEKEMHTILDYVQREWIELQKELKKEV